MDIKLIKLHSKQKEIVKTLLNPNIFFTISVIGRQFGKTTMAENMAIYWALNNSNTTIFWVSPTNTQSQKVYTEIVNAIVESDCIKSRKMPMGNTQIVFKNGSQILFRSAESEDSLRGPSVDYMILDEAAFIKKETFEIILLPMLGVRGKKCFICTTPKGKNWIYDYYCKSKDNPKWASFRYSTYDSPFANENIINMFRENMAPTLFKQEIEAEFVDSASVFNNISEVMVLNKTDEPTPNTSYYAGIDIGLINDASVLSIIDNNGNLINYFRWNRVESPELIQHIVDLEKKWKFRKIWIENNNQGLTIYQELKRKINNIDDINTNSKTKPEMINNLIHLFNMKQLKLIKDEYLRIELEAFIFKQNGNSNIKFMADNGFHDDCVMSLAIARQCYDHYNKKVDMRRINFF